MISATVEGYDVVDRLQHVKFRPDGLGGREPPFAPDVEWRTEGTAKRDEMRVGPLSVTEREWNIYMPAVLGDMIVPVCNFADVASARITWGCAVKTATG